MGECERVSLLLNYEALKTSLLLLLNIGFQMISISKAESAK